MKKFLFIAMAWLMASAALAQNVLEVTDISQPNDVYSSEGNKAVVVVKCNKSIPLTFESTMDKSAKPYNTSIEGSDSIYYIEFPTGSRYRGRVVSVMSPGYSTVTLPLQGDLQPKQVATFRAVDPNSQVDAGCYRGHRNKGMEELKNMNYLEARDQFDVARECSDVDKEENERNIALVDTILYYREKAETTYRLLDYRNASAYYEKVVELNPYDTYASNRYSNCISKFTTECDATFRQAEYYSNEKQYTKALELFQRIIDSECPAKVQAVEQVNKLNLILNQRKNHSRVLTYEYAKDVPVGFSYGKYNMHKAGGFFGMSLNGKVFDMMRNNCRIPDMPEVNVNFGWTLKVANPVWVFFGPGLTAKFYYGDYKIGNQKSGIYPNVDGIPNDPDKKLYPSQDAEDGNTASTAVKKNNTYTNDDEKLNLGWALSPVAGICVKYSYFAIRLTYQYRFAMDSHLKDFMGTQRIGIGVGVSF